MRQTHLWGPAPMHGAQQMLMNAVLGTNTKKATTSSVLEGDEGRKPSDLHRQTWSRGDHRLLRPAKCS